MTDRILVVEDEPDALELIEFNLEAAGFQVATAADGRSGLQKVRDGGISLVILDVMLPEMDGFEVCKALRAHPATAQVPIIMLTARAEEIDRVLGFELGADDYLTKPFSPRELVLRVRGLLRRLHPPDSAEAQVLTFGDLVIDPSRHEVKIQGNRLELTATEFRLLQLMARRRGRVQSRDSLLQEVWGYEKVIDTRTVDTHMRRLREKLGNCADWLETVRGTGYRFRDEGP